MKRYWTLPASQYRANLLLKINVPLVYSTLDLLYPFDSRDAILL